VLSAPADDVNDSDETVGAVVSIIIALLLPNEFAAPGEASVNVALLAAASAIVPLLSASEFVAT
jgi:hypothetical protein